MTAALRRAAPNGRSVPRLSHVEHVMGTAVSIDLCLSDRSAAGMAAARRALERACSELHRADAVFSTWDPRSEISRLRKGLASGEELCAEVHEVLDLCAQVRDLTGGWFDPWAMPGGVDPTGLVKGWAAERALRMLEVRGVTAASVNAGGDVAVFGSPGPEAWWRIGVRHPFRPGSLACVLGVDAALATSGTYERGAHLLDPRTGRPAPSAVSASVVGRSLAIADGLATALAVGGDEVLCAIDALAGYEGYLVRADGTESWTAGAPFLP